MKSAALILAALAGTACADVTMTVSTGQSPAPSFCSASAGGGPVFVSLPPGAPAAVKRDAMMAAFINSGVTCAPGSATPGSAQLILPDLAPGLIVSLNTGTSCSPMDRISSPGVEAGQIRFTGFYPPNTPQGQPASFTAGIVTDLGELTVRVSSSELNFQTDGPIICQALFQRLAPRAPQFGAQVNFAGDRLEVYFDPAYTVTTGGISAGTTSQGQGCSAQITTPPLPCLADLNADGIVDFNDYLEFLNLFNMQDARADFNGDGIVDFNDYLEFLNLYNTAC